MKSKLNYEGFEEYLVEETNRPDTVWLDMGQLSEEDAVWLQYIFRFENGYGASVVKHYGSYGFEDDLFELAVIEYVRDSSEEWDLCYDTEITGDVLGWLSNKDVLETLQRIKEL